MVIFKTTTLIKYTYILITLIFLIACDSNQSDSIKTNTSKLIEKKENGILNHWIITNGFFSDTIELKLLDSMSIDTASINTYEILTFDKNGGLYKWTYNPIPRCGNGVYYLDSSSHWEKGRKNGNIILTLNGGMYPCCKFEQKIVYTIDTSQLDKLALIKSKILYDN